VHLTVGVVEHGVVGVGVQEHPIVPVAPATAACQVLRRSSIVLSRERAVCCLLQAPAVCSKAKATNTRGLPINKLVNMC